MATPKEVYQSDVYCTIAKRPRGMVPWAWFKDVYDALGKVLKEKDHERQAQQAVSEILNEDGYVDTSHLGC